MQVTLENPGEGLFELLIGQGVAEWIHGTVCVAQKVRKHVQVLVRAGRLGAETLNQGKNVIGRPAGDEGAQDEGYGAKGLARPILGPRLLTAQRWVLLLGGLGLETLANGLDQVATRASATALRALARLDVAFARLFLRVLLVYLNQQILNSISLAHFTILKKQFFTKNLVKNE